MNSIKVIIFCKYMNIGYFIVIDIYVSLNFMKSYLFSIGILYVLFVVVR